jgi:hypothetical protein
MNYIDEGSDDKLYDALGSFYALLAMDVPFFMLA